MRCLFVNPRFRTASFWNYRETCEGAGARYPGAPLGLITVAALLPAEWEMRLVDCNVQPWKPELLDWADLVLIGGMMPQQLAALDLIREAKQRGKTVVVGGPDATSSPHIYAEADHLVLGEVENTMARFLEDSAVQSWVKSVVPNADLGHGNGYSFSTQGSKFRVGLRSFRNLSGIERTRVSAALGMAAQAMFPVRVVSRTKADEAFEAILAANSFVLESR